MPEAENLNKKQSSLKKSIKRWMIEKKNYIFISLINAIALFFFSYFLNNFPLFTGESLLLYSWVEYFKDLVVDNNEDESSDVVYINVSYDKQLVDIYDEYGLPLGNSPITDRNKLLRLLQMLKQEDTYSYIFLDVNFEKGFESNNDSILFKEIKEAKRIVIASHPDVELVDSTLIPFSGYNNYYATIVATNFTRYKYLFSGIPTMPLYAYNALTGKSIVQRGPFYFCDNSLCYNSLFLRFPAEKKNEYGNNNIKQYYNLGSDILDNYSVEDLGILCKGKYVVIGDMVTDIHDTYSGVKAGPVITYHAFQEIMEGRHFVSIGLSFFLFILNFVISMSLFTHWNLIDHYNLKVSKSKVLRYLISLLGFTFVFTISSIVIALVADSFVSFMLPSLYFSIQKAIIDFKRI